MAALIAIRNYTGLTIDEILGLPPTGGTSPMSPSERTRLREHLLEEAEELHPGAKELFKEKAQRIATRKAPGKKK